MKNQDKFKIMTHIVGENDTITDVLIVTSRVDLCALDLSQLDGEQRRIFERNLRLAFCAYDFNLAPVNRNVYLCNNNGNKLTYQSNNTTKKSKVMSLFKRKPI